MKMNSRIRLYAAVVALAFAGVVIAQEPEHAHPETGRVPANILKAEQAGILLMEARDKLEEPEKTMDLLGLKDGDIVADLGCGNGYYTLRLAKRVAPSGRVLAVDIQQGMLDQLQTRMTEAGVSNVELILGTPDDPKLPKAGLDWLLLVDVYHEFSDPQAMLAKIREALAPGGKVALLEYRKEQDPATIAFPIPMDHKMSVDEVLREWTPAGFQLVERVEILPAQHIFIFTPSEKAAVPDVAKIRVGGAPNSAVLGDNRVYFAGQPGESDLKTYGHLGVKTIINLRAPGEMAALPFDESKTAEAAGMTYINVPMGREIPAPDQLNQIFDALDRAKDAPVLLHCASANRAGAVWALYRIKRNGLDVEKAIAEGTAAGMKPDAFAEAVRAQATN
jgi:uncharacterized protein (TIGR01244 family)